MKPYNHLPGYLHRWTLFLYKCLHIRIHHILSEDKTPFLHTHPFWYISIILSGGYKEKVLTRNGCEFKTHTRFSIIFRKPTTPHRIESILPNTKTLFITYKSNKPWKLIPHLNPNECKNYWNAPDGIYFNKVKNKYKNRSHGIWYCESSTYAGAYLKQNQSIHQDLDSNLWVKI